MDYPPPDVLSAPLEVFEDIVLMGAGPTNVDDRILKALSRPIMSHFDPEIFKIMEDVKEGLKYLFQTENTVTICISGAGHGAIEASLCNVIEDGDVVLIGHSGYWGMRAGDMAERYGADVRYLKSEVGSILSLEEIEDSFIRHKPVIFFIAQSESTAGVLQPIEGIGPLCRKYDCILIVDTVASLGGVPFFTDRWLVDIAYTGGQKCIGAAPGISPITFNERALAKIYKRKTKVKIYYLDITVLGDYWNCFGRPRVYHHTLSSTLLFALREALSMICEETLEVRTARQEECSQKLQRGLEALGLEMFVKEPRHRLPTIQAVKVPDGVDLNKVSAYVMENYKLQLAPGVGPTTGLVWRIGLLGRNATIERVNLTLHALAEAIRETSSFKLSI